MLAASGQPAFGQTGSGQAGSGQGASGQAPPSTDPYFTVSLPPGTYAASQTLAVTLKAPEVALRYSFRRPDGSEGPWVPWREPLELTAAAGEIRDYSIQIRVDSQGQEVARRELPYRIDRRPPGPPGVNPAPGYYYGPISVVLSGEPGSTIYYATGADVLRLAQPWSGTPIVVGQAGGRGTSIVQAYAQDATGNRSSISSFTYTVDARPPELGIESPVEGTFANIQCLSVSFRGVRWVRYTTDGSDPTRSGVPYTGPTLVGRPGVNRIRVAAQPSAPGQSPLQREVSFTYTPESVASVRVDAQSGAYEKGLTPRATAPTQGTLYYALSERTPGISDPRLSDSVSLPALASTVRPVTLRIRSLGSDGAWGPEYRFFYLVGKSSVTAPSVLVRSAEPLMGPASLQLVGPEDALVRYTLDGSAPGPSSPLAGGPIDVTPPQGASALVVRTQAMDGSGALSPVVDRSIAIYAARDRPPAVQAATDAKSGTVVFSAAGETRPLVFELTSDGSDPPSPSERSPRLVLPLSVTVPFGVERTFKLRAAAVDPAGRVIAASDAVSAVLDRAPPPRPELSPPPGGDPAVAPVSVQIQSAGQVSYTVTSDGSMPKDPTAIGASASPAVNLPGVDGALTTYRLKIVTVDAAGNASEVYGPFSYPVDLRAPLLPSITGIADGGRYGQSPVYPVVGPSPWKVVYTATTDGSAPADPDASSPAFSRDTAFVGDPGNERTFRVKLLAISQNGQRKGESRELRFMIDLKPPDVPELTGVTTGASYAKPVTISAPPSSDAAQLYYSVSTTADDPPDPLKAGQPLPPSLGFDAPDGTSRTFTIRVAAVDVVGNRSLYDRRYSFTIDRQSPEDPQVTVTPDVSVTNAPVTVSAAAGAPVIRYELTDDGSQPPLPGDTSTSYAGPMLLAGKAGASVTYHLVARAFDRLGNASPGARLVTVTIDRTVPAPPSPPQIRYAPGSPAAVYLSWDAPGTGRLLVRLRSPAGLLPDYTAYTGPIVINAPDTQPVMVSGDAVAENDAGSRSQPVPFAQTLGGTMPAPEVRGARNGGIYNTAVDLRLERPGAEVRYEISTDGSFPPTVVASSPLISGPLHLDAVDGETVDVRIAARAFDPSGSEAASDEVRLGFRIDRTPPDQPVAVGIQNDGYYQDQRTVTILSTEGAIYYTVAAGKGAAVPTTTDDDLYRGPFVLDVSPGNVVSYTVAAYCVDAAGNRSRSVSVWAVTIDNQNIYVSPSGSDYADGSRGTPFRTLGRAVSALKPRSRILLATGEYPIDSTVVLDRDVVIAGGMDPQTWQQAGPDQGSVLTAGSRLTASAIVVTGGSVSMRELELRDASRPIPATLSVSGGAVRLDHVTVSLSGLATGIGMDVGGGNLTVTDSQLRAAAVGRGTLLSAEGGSVDISGASFSGPADSLDFACIGVSGARSLSLQAATLDPGSGQRTRGIRAFRSQIRITGGNIGSGYGTVEAMAIDASSSDLTVDGVTVTARGWSPIGILSAASTVRVTRSSLSIAGSSSAVGVGARGGQLALVRSTLRAADASEYLALARLEDTTALVADNLLVGGTADQSFALSTRGGLVDILNNTIVGGTGASMTAGVLVQGDRAPRVINNVMARLGDPKGSAVLFIGATRVLASGTNVLASATTAGEPPAAAGKPSDGPAVTILTNSFSGWERLVRVEYSAGRPPLQAVDLGSINSLDGNPDGGPIQGNIVESPDLTFQAAGVGDYHLRPGSACADAASDPNTIPGLIDTGALAAISSADWASDLDGRLRPVQQSTGVPGSSEGWDIGAYESSP